MFKLPGSPSPQATHPELADFAEILCIDLGSASKQEILAHLGKVGDNEFNSGIDDEEGKASDDLDDVMNELDRRQKACGSKAYPFALSRAGSVLTKGTAIPPTRALVYEYLLFSTRLDMKNNKVQAGIDGTHLLEEIAAVALKNYLGPVRSKTHVFGTSNSGNFKDKVDALCEALREGSHFRAKDPRVIQQDGSLDAVAWTPFADARGGQLVMFAQCKTGTEWRNDATQLSPSAFIHSWMHDPLAHEPVRVYCISEACDSSRWYATGSLAGILFDRCRLVDFCDGIPDALLKRITKWNKAVRKTLPYSQPARTKQHRSKKK